MNFFFSIAIIIALLFPTLSKLGILIDFKLNQEYIASLFCENKDKPVMQCNGKCHLSKQLKKTAEQEEKQMPNQEEKYEPVFPIANLSIEIFSNTASFSRTAFVSNPHKYLSIFIEGVFHPPKV